MMRTHARTRDFPAQMVLTMEDAVMKMQISTPDIIQAHDPGIAVVMVGKDDGQTKRRHCQVR